MSRIRANTKKRDSHIFLHTERTGSELKELYERLKVRAGSRGGALVSVVQDGLVGTAPPLLSVVTSGNNNTLTQQ